MCFLQWLKSKFVQYPPRNAGHRAEQTQYVESANHSQNSKSGHVSTSFSFFSNNSLK